MPTHIKGLIIEVVMDGKVCWRAFDREEFGSVENYTFATGDRLFNSNGDSYRFGKMSVTSTA